MLWRFRSFCYVSSFACGCYSLALLKRTAFQSENDDQKQNSRADDSSITSFLDVTGNYFCEDYGTYQSSFLLNKTPIYWWLLMLTKSKKRSQRHKAIKYLSELNNLKKWEYIMIAQACGPSTAIGLARSPKLNPSFFFSSPFRAHKIDNLSEEFLDLIALLPHQEIDSSIQVWFKKAKKIRYRMIKKENLSDEPESFFDIYHSEQKKRDIFGFYRLCLQILVNHSTIKSHRLLMVENGILKLLWEVLQHPNVESILLSLTAQILANLALEEELRNVLYATGFIGILAVWSRSENISVSLPSAKALANLDVDDYNHSFYENDIYLLHPVTRCSDRTLSADVIFVHGLFGATFWTWRQNDVMKKNVFEGNIDEKKLQIYEQPSLKNPNHQSYTFCWPKDWLAEDLLNLRLLSIDYNTRGHKLKSLNSLQQQKENLSAKATLLMHKLIKARVGEKPIIWVTHSMGGIIVKQLLLEASVSEDDKANLIAKKTTGIIFFSVPHKGSEFATLLQSVPNIFQPSMEFSQLHKGSSLLLTLHNDFLNFARKNNIAVLSFGETKKSKGWLDVVSEESSDPGIGEFSAIPVDHLSTCKPESRTSEVYLKVKEFIQSNIPVPIHSSKDYSIFEIVNVMTLIS